MAKSVQILLPFNDLSAYFFYIVDMVSGFETLTLLCFAHMKQPNIFQPQITLKWETLINSQTLNLKEDENMKKLRQIHSTTSKSLALQ